MRLGADPDQLDRLAAAFAAAAERLQRVEHRLAAARGGAAGPSAAVRAAYVLMAEVEPLLRAVAIGCTRRAEHLRGRAARQRQASIVPRLPGGMVTVREDRAGDGRWIGRAGPADAPTVVVLVPGVGTVNTHRRRLGRDAVRLRRHLVTRYPDRETAVVAWVGYDTPDHVVAGVDRRPAAVAADELRAELTALRSAGAERVVLVGHSYGALVAARAVAGGAAVDELVLLGAPGLGVDDPSRLRAHVAGSVWSAMEDDDRIAWVARTGVLHGPDPAESARPLPTAEHGHARYLADPVLVEALGQVVAGERR